MTAITQNMGRKGLTTLWSKRGLGFIEDIETHKRYFTRISQTNGVSLRQGEIVTFGIAPNPRTKDQLMAVEVKIDNFSEKDETNEQNRTRS